MGCPCGGEITMAKDEVILRIDELDMKIFDEYETVVANVGAGLSDIADTLEECCKANATTIKEQNAGSADLPPIESMQTVVTENPDGSTTTTTTTTQLAAAKTITAGSAADMTAYAIAYQCQQAEYQAALYQQQTNAFLQAEQSWRNAQIAPLLAQLIAQGLLVTQMYGLWKDYLEKTNDVICGLTDDAFPTALENYQTATNAYQDHLDLQVADYADDRDRYRDRIDWACERADLLSDHTTMSGEGFAGYLTLDAQHTQNAAQDVKNIMGVGQACIQEAKPYLTDLRNRLAVESQWTTDQIGEMTGELQRLYRKAGDLCEFVNDCGQALVNTYQNEELATTRPMLDAAVANATECLADIRAAITEAETCMREQKALYEAHAVEMRTFGPEVISQANALLDCGDLMKDCWQDANACAETLKDRYELTDGCQDELAKKMMEIACNMAANYEDLYECQKTIATECFDHWKDHYAACDASLAEAITAQAKTLVETRTATFETFTEHHEKLWSDFCDHYWPLERQFSATLLAKAETQICELDASLEEICTEAYEFLDWWRCAYQDEEKITSPKIIRAGVDACEQQIDTYTKLDDMLDELCQKWFNEVCDCDLGDIQALCKLHEKTDVVCDVVENTECIETIADRFKTCWLEDGLPCEKDYLQELCDLEPYDPNYCDVEDRAVMHVRRRFDQAKESLMRQSSRYCVGDIEETLCKLESEQALAEAQAIELANRHEKWWAVQEDNRRHTKKMNMIETYQSFAALAMQGFETADNQYAMLMTQLHNRLSRSYTYLSQANQAGSTAAGSTAQGVSQAMDATRIGQFYPELWRNLKADYHNNSQAMIQRAQQQVQLGHFHASSALDTISRADGVAEQQITQAQQTLTHGRQFKQAAITAGDSARTVNDSVHNISLQHIDDKNVLLQEARAWKSLEWQTVCDTVTKAQNQFQQAEAVLAQAFAFEQHRDQLLQNCVDTGFNAEDRRFAIYQAGAAKVERALASAENALSNALTQYQSTWQTQQGMFDRMFNLGQLVAPNAGALDAITRRGQNWMAIAAQMHQQGMVDKGSQLKEVCDALRARENDACQCLLGFLGVGNAAAGLTGQFGQGLGSGVEGLLGTLQAFTGTVPSIAQFPQQPNFTTTAPTTTFIQGTGNGSAGNFNSPTGIFLPSPGS